MAPIQVEPRRSVFINCPFDLSYAPLFEAILFATSACGYVPRSALESGTVAEPRMERILKALFESKYSIHDLSRCRGEGDERLARFNMPLELGIAMARRYGERRSKNRHDWLVLVPEGHGYQKFVSDLAGYDPGTHPETVEGVVPKVMTWLASRPDTGRIPNSKTVLAALPRFQARRKKLGVEWSGEVPWRLVLEAAEELVPESPDT